MSVGSLLRERVQSAFQRGLKALRRLRLERLVLSVMGAKGSTAAKAERPRTKLEERLVEELAKRAQSGKTGFKAFNTIILKFPKIDESFEAVRTVFKKYDKDGSGTIDLEELKVLFQELEVDYTDEEVKSFHEASDMDSSKGIDFKEFIVLLSLVYFLGKPADSDPDSKSRIGFPDLEATFETIVDAFVFFDSNGDGYVSKNELVASLSQATPGRQADKIGMRRFEEMDWDKNGMVTFKEFLFAFTNWVGLEEEQEPEVRSCWICCKR
ncbi:hypothetical protein R1sor_015039 [Riccia sorocarpa]|uniref:EF-hand domain-containing protein n=1 Tax=Riccia sorocarpa TaxID=122646 RepID=A0ABD3HEZ1_9MARC